MILFINKQLANWEFQNLSNKIVLAKQFQNKKRNFEKQILKNKKILF